MNTDSSHSLTAFDAVTTAIHPGLTLIEASAGTGKTYAISHLVPRLLMEGTLDTVDELVLVTFTNDAARELSDRVRQILSLLAAPPADDESSKQKGVAALRQRFAADPVAQERLARAMRSIDRLNVSTIHSFCQRVLQQEGNLCGLPSIPELLPDAGGLVEEAVREFWQRELTHNTLLASIASARNWSPDKDELVVHRRLGLESPVFKPEPLPWEEILENMERLHKQVPEALRKVRMVLLESGDALLKKRARLKLAALTPPSDATALAPQLAELKILLSQRKEFTTSAKNRDTIAAFELSVEWQLCLRMKELLDALQWKWQQRCAEYCNEWIARQLEARRLITYDGLIEVLHRALTKSATREQLRKRLASRLHLAIIDESQDTDARQFAIFERIFLDSGPDQRLLLIGDPKQSIYAFRGADVNTYLAARRRPGVRINTLHRTFRAPTPLVNAVNAFFKRKEALLNPEMHFQPALSGVEKPENLTIEGRLVVSRIVAWRVDDAEASAYSAGRKRLSQISRRTVAEISRLLNEGRIEKEGVSRRVAPGDCAVLVSTGREAAAIAEALQEAGIPGIVSSGENILGSEEATEMLTLLQAVLAPRHSGLRNAALATRMLGFNSSQLRRANEDPFLAEEQLRRFVHWNDLWHRRDFGCLIAAIDTEAGIVRRLALDPLGERRVTNFRHLCDLLQATQRERTFGPAALEAWFSGEISFASRQSKLSDEERQLRLESDSLAVQIVTMHKSKGLEYNLVFCPFLFTGSKPRGIEILRTGGSERLVNTELLESGDSLLDELFQAQLEDRLRLAYVAMTRAKIRLWLWCGALGCKAPSALEASSLDWLLRAGNPPSPGADKLVAWRESLRPSKGNPIPRGALHASGLSSLQELAPGLIEVLPPPAPEYADLSAIPNEDPRSLLVLASASRIPAAWSTASFSSITRERHPHDSRLIEDNPVASPGQSAETEPAPACNAFLQAPAGAAIGTAIHEWIENWDFSALDEEALQRHLDRHKLPEPAPQHSGTTADKVRDMLLELRGATLPGLDCSIATACSDTHGSEWHFHLPLRGCFDTGRLAEVFRLHAEPKLAFYAEQLVNLGGQTLSGFVQGFIDRLAWHEGRWGLIDWKTNLLGEDPGCYTRNGLMECAAEAHYLLQGHLYLVALRRHLRLLGVTDAPAGAWFVFLRAVRSGTHEGILHVNPPGPLLDALEALLDEPAMEILS